MHETTTTASDTDLGLVAREPWHPALWGGLALQLAAVAAAAVLWSDWYDDGLDAPWWADVAGAASAVIALAGGIVAAWWPRRQDRAPVEGAAWLRACWQLLFVFAIGVVLTIASLFTDGTSWGSVLLISAGIGTMLLPIPTLLLVVGPVVLLTDVRRPGVDARWYDVAAMTALMPWVAVLASSLAGAVPDTGEPMTRGDHLAEWIGVVVGTTEPREPWLAWLVRAVTIVFLVILWRAAVVSRRTLAARREVR
ncbi:hypothetical protein [Nocardioides renjunii]|uniref:hypothetical protein n=1 Tax=Nocardioides renjunii TaxID=3095075 RepID=UPI002B003BBB|nr:hypothetical protein [Nocardioides sp. S-34]WQQ24344.1 hypothetical protein SHK17_10215 [Nocardioides sp. S-34]